MGTQLHADSGLEDLDLIHKEADEPVSLHREKVFPEALDILEGIRPLESVALRLLIRPDEV